MYQLRLISSIPTFPLFFAKPYDGSLSKDLFVVRNREELTPEILNHPKLIFMEYIDKREYKGVYGGYVLWQR